MSHPATTDASVREQPATEPAAWWRWLAADVLDLVAVAAAGAAGSGITAVLLHEDLQADGLGSLGAALLVLFAGVAAAAVCWVWLLVLAWRGGTLGQRRLGVPTAEGGWARVGVAVLRHTGVVALVLLSGWPAVLAEPGATGLVGPTLAAAAMAALVQLLYRPVTRGRRATTVGVAALLGASLGLGLALAVPDRPPTIYEDRAAIERAIVDRLDDEPAAVRLCDLGSVGPGDVPRASHRTTPCGDPDRAWMTRVPARDLARDVTAAAAGTSSRPVELRTDDRGGLVVVTDGADEVPVAVVLDLACGTGVAVAPRFSRVGEQDVEQLLASCQTAPGARPDQQLRS